MKHKFNIFGIVLLGASLGCHALTLGRVRGAVLVGQPLNVVVPVQIDAGENASTFCFEADVFHADARQDGSRVRVLYETTGQVNTANVRVMSSAIIDEPVVTVYLRTGCGQKTSRQYVLLADLPSDISALSLASRITPIAGLSLTPATTISRSTSPTSPSSGTKPGAKAPASRAPTSIARATGANKRPSVQASATATRSSQSRLKLDLLDDLSDRVANLDTFMTFEPPADALLSFQKIQTLESDVQTLRTLAAKNEVSLSDLKTRLLKAESERFPLGIVYGLIALVLAGCAALAYFWNRQRRAAIEKEWWSGSLAEPDAHSAEPPLATAPESALAREEAREGVEQPLPPVSVQAVLPEDTELLSVPGVDLMEMTESEFNHLIQSAGNPSASRPPAASPVQVSTSPKGAIQLLNSDEIQDVRQQAEFFVSLGQTDRAVRILKKQIEESMESNPFIYLDLLSLLHSLGQKVDFQMFRLDFNRLFKGKVPEFSYFKKEGRGLDSYPEVLARIAAIWPKHSVMAVIDECIFSHPGAVPAQSFELAAFRELLFLNDIAQSVVLAAPSDQTGSAAQSHELDLDLSDIEGDAVAEGPITVSNLVEFDLTDVSIPAKPGDKKPV